jgi:hypothetical protein
MRALTNTHEVTRLLAEWAKGNKACQYALALWKKLTCFLEYPELELRSCNKTYRVRPHVVAWKVAVYSTEVPWLRLLFPTPCGI